MAQVFEEHFATGTIDSQVNLANTAYTVSWGALPTYVDSPIDSDLAAKFDGGAGYGYLRAEFTSTMARTFSRYVQFDNGTYTTGNSMIISIASGGTSRGQVTLRSNGTFGLRSGSILQSSTEYLMEPDKLYRLVWKVNDTAQSLEVRDGLTDVLIEAISASIEGGGFDSVNDGWVGSPNGTINMIMDRCVDDDTITDIPPYSATPGSFTAVEDFEAGVDQADITTASTFFSSGWSAASKFSASQSIDQGLAMRTAVVAQNSFHTYVLPSESAQLWLSFYLYIDQRPTANTTIAEWHDGTDATSGSVRLMAAGELRLADQFTTRWASDVLVVGEWHRVDIYIEPGSSNYRLKIYSGANLHTMTASQDSGDQTMTLAGSLPIGSIVFGAMNTTTADYSFDYIQVSNASQPAPYEAEANEPPGEIALLGQAVENTWGSSITVNYSSTAGNTLVLLVGASDGLVDTVSDTAGNTWVQAANTSTIPTIDAQRRGQLYYCLNAASVSSVTVSRSDSHVFMALLTEWSGVAGLRGALASRKSINEIPIAAETGDLIISASFVYENPIVITSAPAGYTDLSPVTRDSYVTNSGYKIAETSGEHEAVWSTKPNSGLINAAFIPATVAPPDGPEVLFEWNGDNGQVIPSINSGGVTIEDEGMRPPVLRMDSTSETRSVAQWDVGAKTQSTVRAYFKTPSAWTGNSVTLIQFASGWTGHARFALGGSGQPGQVRITSLGGTSQYSSNNVVENDTWYRVEFMIDQVNSRARFYLYEGDSELLHHGTGWVSADFGSSFDMVRIGIDNNTGSSPYLFDDIKAIDELRLLGPARPAPLYEYGYEEGTDAQAITTASPGVISTAGSPVYTNSEVAHGGMAALLPAVSPASALYYGAPNNSAFTLSFYTQLNVKGSSAAYALRLLDDSSVMAAFRFHPDGKFDLSNSSQTRVASSNISYETDKWYRVDTQVSLDTSTLHIKSAIYEPHESVYPVETLESSFTGVSDITRFSLATSQASWSLTFDTLRVYDGLIEPGPYGPPVSPVGSVLHSWVGAPTQTAFQVVTKLSGTMSARLAVSLDEDMAAPTYTEAIEPSAEGYVRFDATGFSPGQQYYYQVECNGSLIGPIGRARTLRQQAVPQNFTVAVGSCVLKNKNDGVAIDDLRLWNPDLFIHLGDFYYTSSTSDDPATFEALYADLIQTYPGLSQLMGEIPSYYTVSDHEAGVDNGDSNNIWTEAHIKAYRQVAPHRMVDTSPAPRGRWQSWVIGRVRFIMLDIRHLDRTPGAEVDNASKTMLGATQKAWLKSELLQPELLKVIISDVGWMGPSSLTNGTDKWWAYSTERQEIIDFIQTNNVNVDLWHGDSHSIAVAGKSTNSYGGFPVLCASPLAQTGGGRNLNEFDSYYNNSGGEARQYMRITFTDDGTTITRTASGWDAAAGVERVSSIETWSGSSGGSGPNVTVWDGSQRLPATLRGVWDGTQIIPGSIKNIE